MDVPYMDYKELREGFYTIPEVCNLFQCTKKQLEQACKRHEVNPAKEADVWGSLWTPLKSFIIEFIMPPSGNRKTPAPGAN